MKTSLLVLTLSGFLLSTGVGNAVAQDLGTVLDEPTLYFEASVRAASFRYAVIGRPDQSACINSIYFSAPTAVRTVVEAIWKHRDRSLLGVLVLQLEKWCPPGKEPLPTVDGLWKVSPLDNISLERPDDVDLLVSAMLRMMVAYSVADKDPEATACLNDRFDSRAFSNDVLKLFELTPQPSIAAAVFSAAQTGCGYPRDGLEALTVDSPTAPDTIGAGKERLLAISDLHRCGLEGNASAQKSCIDSAYAERVAATLGAVLSENQRKLDENARAREDMLARAMRLPDGRPIFEDKNGIWHFEDGSIVDAVLAAKRVPPKS